MPIRWSKSESDLGGAVCHDDLFASPQWARVMSSLGARCWRGVGEQNDQVVNLFVWHKGPLKVGFLGFPVTPAWAAEASRKIDAAHLPERIDLLRVSLSTLDGQADRGGANTALPESVIPNLGDWPQRNRKKIKKDLSFARRHGVVVRDAASDDAQLIESIYLETIARNKGRLRYNADYFAALIELSTSSPFVQVRMACHETHTVGFCVTATQHDRAYYLHAGVAGQHRKLGAADVLADDAIQWAIACGGKSFSLMASPPEQPGLQKFKHKWSEAEEQWIVSDHAFGIAGWLVTTALKFR